MIFTGPSTITNDVCHLIHNTTNCNTTYNFDTQVPLLDNLPRVESCIHTYILLQHYSQFRTWHASIYYFFLSQSIPNHSFYSHRFITNNPQAPVYQVLTYCNKLRQSEHKMLSRHTCQFFPCFLNSDPHLSRLPFNSSTEIQPDFDQLTVQTTCYFDKRSSKMAGNGPCRRIGLEV